MSFGNKLTGIARRRQSWLLLIVIPYFASMFWLGGLVISCPPCVLLYAPAGLIAVLCVHYIPGKEIEAYYGYNVLVHFLFWPAYLVGAMGARVLSPRVLRPLFLTLCIIVVLTFFGCATLVQHVNFR